MAKGKRYSYGEFVERKLNTGTITIEMSEELTIKVPPPEVWSDEVLDKSDVDPVAAARELLGDEQYDRFRDAGGNAATLFGIVADANGMTPGESGASASS